MSVYYNERDPFAAEWLRQLIAAGELPAGFVDERDIKDVQPEDLAGYTQCHFFAGIGGWPYALRLAGWPDDRPVWTGSCPCQPFSAAGKRRGVEDERHLWPIFRDLIAKCRPPVVFGEQVEAAIRMGWLDGIRADLEGAGYAVGAAVLGAHSVGAPHIRQRLYWLADSGSLKRQHGERHAGIRATDDGATSTAIGLGANGASCGLGDADDERPQGRIVGGHGADERPAGAPGVGGFWSRAEWLACSDGKARRVEPGIFPLAHGVPNRVGTLRGAGNAIVPQVAAEFIGAYLDDSPLS